MSIIAGVTIPSLVLTLLLLGVGNRVAIVKLDTVCFGKGLEIYL